MLELGTRVRFAPSPTGFLHVGGARTALYNYLYARHTGGSFILRIEDTDRTRYQANSLDDLLEGLRWLGLDWDEGPDVGGDYGPYTQSQRLELYQKFAEQLVRGGKAYYCFCSAERLSLMREEQQGIVPVVRLKAPLDGTTSFHDSIRGDISVDNSTLDDMVLLKSDGFPTYHLAAVVDDHLMKISHIMRGDE